MNIAAMMQHFISFHNVLSSSELTSLSWSGQLRNLEKAFNGGDEAGGRPPVKVCDRTALILDIFSQRAQTREGKLQVGRGGQAVAAAFVCLTLFENHVQSDNNHCPVIVTDMTRHPVQVELAQVEYQLPPPLRPGGAGPGRVPAPPAHEDVDAS